MQFADVLKDDAAKIYNERDYEENWTENRRKPCSNSRHQRIPDWCYQNQLLRGGGGLRKKEAAQKALSTHYNHSFTTILASIADLIRLWSNIEGDGQQNAEELHYELENTAWRGGRFKCIMKKRERASPGEKANINDIRGTACPQGLTNAIINIHHHLASAQYMRNEGDPTNGPVNTTKPPLTHSRIRWDRTRTVTHPYRHFLQCKHYEAGGSRCPTPLLSLACSLA